MQRSPSVQAVLRHHIDLMWGTTIVRGPHDITVFNRVGVGGSREGQLTSAMYFRTSRWVRSLRGKKELVEVVWVPENATLTQHSTVCSWASISTLFPVCFFCKIEVTAQQNYAWIWSMNNANSVYRNVCSFSCYRSLLLFSGSHLFLLNAVHTITILITKIIAACITLLLFDNIFHVQEGLLKLSSLTSHTVQAFSLSHSHSKSHHGAIKNTSIFSQARLQL